MRVICDTQKLSEVCQVIQKVVSTKSTIPAIEGILLKALGNELILSAYDLEVGINTSINAKIEEPGSIVLNAKTLCDILRHLPGETVTIASEDDRLKYKIKSGESEFSLMGISATDFPEIPNVDSGFPIVVESKILKEMVSQTIFAVATNDSKVIHTGIKFEISEKKIKLVALDGFRLAIRTENIDYSGKDVSFVVPAKSIDEVVKTATSNDSVIAINLGKRHISFEVENYTIVSRLLEGEFLNYTTAIPLSGTTVARVDTKTFIQSIERTSLIITDKFKSPLRCIFDTDSIKISSVTSVGTANDKIPAKIDGGRVEIGFNNRYIFDALKNCNVDEVRIELNGPTSPIVILPPENDNFLYLVLPMRLKA